MKHIAKAPSFDLSEITDIKIYEAVKSVQSKAKKWLNSWEWLTFLKNWHSLWGDKISIVGIDGGIHKDTSANEYDDDNDSDGDDEDDVSSAGLQNVICFSEDIPINKSIKVSEDLTSMTNANVIDNALQQRFQQQK